MTLEAPAGKQPSPDVLAAIVAAVDEAWPRPAVPAPVEGRPRSAWRFSGRWWAGPGAIGGARRWGQARGR